MPTAHADTARTLLGASVVINVLANDSGSTLSIVGYTMPAFGTLALNPDQSFTYTPPADFVGNDGFAYTVRDSIGGTAAADVTITIVRPNSAPAAHNDSAQTLAGDSVVVPALANDNDADGDTFGIIGIDAPGHGTIEVQPDQTIRYTPEAGFSGIDSFTYTIGDGLGGVGTANVTITVTARNSAPVAGPDTAITHTGAAVTIDALANDHDPDGGPVSLAGMTMPGHGSLSLTPDQRFVYTPTAGFIGADSFTYSIRDADGAAATGQVDVTVERSNAPPVATPDHAASAGERVTLNLLANDNDADGDPLQLTALTVPLMGQIAVNPDRTVTYTPPSGFTGTDSFTYQVSDGIEVVEAEVTLAVTAPVIPTYANGYRYRRRLVVPSQAAGSEIATNFVLLVSESGDWLKSAANGGKVQHAQGFDLRFELEDGTKLDHEIERHDLAAGSLMAWVRLPNIDLTSQTRLLLYYGKPALSATEANPTGVWQAYLAVYDVRTGSDRTGRGRSLTPSGVAAGTLLGDAGAFDGSAVARRSDATFLAGQTAMTVQALAAADSTMLGTNHGILAQGPMDGNDGSAGLILQYLAQTSDGTPNVVHFKLTCADGAAYVLSGANVQRAEPQLLHGVWRQGQPPTLFVDGVEATASVVSAARSGVSVMPAGGFYVGAGARDPATGGWRGLIDEVRIAGTAFSAARIAAEAANLASPQRLYGLGDEDQPTQTDEAPVAMPFQVATTAAAHVDVDVAAAAYDPDGPGPCELVGVDAPAHGVATASGGVIRYTPMAGYVGKDWFAYTLDNAGKRSRSTVSVQVSSGPSPAYAWTHAFPNGAGVDPSKVKLWSIGSAIPAHDVGDIVLGVGPAEAITANTLAGQFKGPLVLVGLTLKPVGTLAADYSTATNPVLGTTALLRPNFTADARSHWTWEGRDWPFLFLANIYVDYQVNACSFGDFIRVQQIGHQTNAADGSLRGPKAIVIQNKIYMNKGPHYVSNTVNPAENGHSDGIQSLGGIPIYRAADSYFNWPGGQLYFSGREASDCGWPRTTRWDMRNVAMDHAAFWNNNVRSHVLNTNPQFIKAYEEQADSFELYDYDSGKYMAVYFGSQCYVRGRFALSDTVNIKKYIGGPGGITGVDSNGNWQFNSLVKGNHTYPAYSGPVRYLPSSAAIPPTCDPNHTGSALRITSVAQFMNIIRS